MPLLQKRPKLPGLFCKKRVFCFCNNGLSCVKKILWRISLLPKIPQLIVALLQKEPPRDDYASFANEFYICRTLLGNSPSKIGLFLAKRSDN